MEQEMILSDAQAMALALHPFRIFYGPTEELSMTPDASAGSAPTDAAAPASAHKAHVFEGKPDGRQAGGLIPVSRFRPQYRALTDEEKALHDALKDKAAEMEALFSKVKPGRYNALAITSLEQSVMWIVKELTS
jgi:hypothetical protein